MSFVQEWSSRVRARNVEYQAACGLVKDEKKAVRAAVQRLNDLEEARTLLQAVVQQVQQQVHRRIASVVTRSLASVFDEPYEFVIHFEQKRGKTEAELKFLREGLEVDPLSASGGGVVDVAAFALRLSCLMLARPPLARVVVLDEPFKFVSREFLPRVASLLEVLAEELKVQIVMVTHIQELRVGDVVVLQ